MVPSLFQIAYPFLTTGLWIVTVSEALCFTPLQKVIYQIQNTVCIQPSSLKVLVLNMNPFSFESAYLQKKKHMMERRTLQNINTQSLLVYTCEVFCCSFGSYTSFTWRAENMLLHLSCCDFWSYLYFKGNIFYHFHSSHMACSKTHWNQWKNSAFTLMCFGSGPQLPG